MQLIKSKIFQTLSKSLLILTSIIGTSLTHSYSSLTHKMMLKKIPSHKLFISEPDPSWFGNQANDKANPDWTNKNWLKSRFHFSFAEYNNEDNSNFGVLRVLNDDLVQPARGFGEHPHRNVEICTYVVEGFLTHKDSMGTEETLGRGAIQFMTAGKGVYHSEANNDPKLPLRFLQLWINTRQSGIKPNYGSFSTDLESRRNKWNHIVSDVKSKVTTPIKINQDANILVTELEPTSSESEPTTVTYTLQANRQAYLVCVEGNVLVKISNESENKSSSLTRHDAAEIIGPATVTVQLIGTSISSSSSSLSSSSGESSESRSEHSSATHLLMVEMAKEGYGRSDL